MHCVKKANKSHNKNTVLVVTFFFVVFECVGFFTAAYKHADGKKIDGRRVLVDVERARTVKGWLPRRLGKNIYFTNKFQLENDKLFQQTDFSVVF